MAFSASTFHMSLAGLLRSVLTRIAAPLHQRQQRVQLFWRQYQPTSRTPNAPSKTTSSGICDPSRVWHHLLADLQDSLGAIPAVQSEVRCSVSFPTCPRLSNSPASSVIHSMIFQSDSTLHFNRASSRIFMALTCPAQS